MNPPAPKQGRSEPQETGIFAPADKLSSIKPIVNFFKGAGLSIS